MSTFPEASAVSVATSGSDFDRARDFLRAGQFTQAETHFRAHLHQHPKDADGVGLLADMLIRIGRSGEAEKLLSEFVVQSPDASSIRSRYAAVLLTGNKMPELFAQLDELIRLEPEKLSHRQKKADACAWIGDYNAAISEYERILEKNPADSGPWLAYARTLRWANRLEESIAAYRNALARFPDLGEAWWSLASIKTFSFTAEELEQLRGRAETANLPLDSAAQMRFALAKAFDDNDDFNDALTQLRLGNNTIRAAIDYDANLNTAYVDSCKSLFTKNFFAEHKDAGCASDAPIFIVGLPRSGSTLVEQILASHPDVEATSELRSLISLAERATRAAQLPERQICYPEVLRVLNAGRLKALGEEYLERTSKQRRLGRVRFLDKMPENVLHVGLICLILPNAKIVDVRRHPMACCLSCYQHYFSAGKNFSFGLYDLGRYYRDYVSLMAHFDSVLPGRIHRVIYEHLVEKPEKEISSLLNYVGLAPDDRCLRFYESERPVQTWSAEQVRMPLFKTGSQKWRKYESGLAGLKQALGPVLDAYPVAPQFAKSAPPAPQQLSAVERQLWAELQLSRPTLPQIPDWRRPSSVPANA